MFNTLFYRPIANLMIYLYNTIAVHDLGIAIIILTIIIRFILYPFFHKMFHQQAMTIKMKPEITEIQKKYKDDQKAQGEELMKLYKKYNINPMYPFLFMIVQIPIMFALFKACTEGIKTGFNGLLYSFVVKPETVNINFLGSINITERSVLLIALVIIFQFLQSKIGSNIPKDDIKQQKMNNMMAIVGVLIILPFAWYFPAAVSIYLIVGSVFSIIQQLVCNRSIKNEELKGTNK
ncbi:MAG: YidC/Oxa1 family membrane protein insertase [Patescibacteria group bacterium]|nr:YidC/Oxa1 family membrane protein insertase [Patescibacteria group bacterium]